MWHFVRKVPDGIAVQVPHLKPSFYDSTFDKIMALFLQSLMCVTSGFRDNSNYATMYHTIVLFSRRLAFEE